MAKLKKKHMDELDLELLAILYYKGEATATDLEKELEGKITKAGISKRLKWLVEHGYLEKPIDDISTGKLRRIYKAPAKEKLKDIFLEWYKNEIYEPIIDEFLTEEEAKKAKEEEPPEKAFKDYRISTLSFKPAEVLRKLREGVSLEEAIAILKESEEDYPYSELFEYEITGLIKVEDNTVKLTEEGYRAVLKEWIPRLREKLKELREFDFNTYKKLIAEFCKDLA